MSSRRSQLFLTLRLFFWADVVLFLVLVAWFFYLRSQRSSLLEIVERQLAFNIRLSADLAYANDLLTNRVFSATSVFVSNFVNSVSVSSPFSPSPVSASFASSVTPELPPVSFSGYFECNGVPYIRVRNTFFRQGDFLLGFPIQAISPDVVQYRDKFYKVDEVSR